MPVITHETLLESHNAIWRNYGHFLEAMSSGDHQTATTMLDRMQTLKNEATAFYEKCEPRSKAKHHALYLMRAAEMAYSSSQTHGTNHTTGINAEDLG